METIKSHVAPQVQEALASGLSCPIPFSDYPQVLIAHGGGGKLTADLIEKIFIPAFRNPQLETRHDGAVIEIGDTRLAFTTDSYVVHPLFFPGGDIGSLAVNGTVNDLAMCGAKPLYLSAGFILEAGLPMETLWRVVQSMKRAAEAAGVRLVTGDTKVVERGKGDGLYINTAGLGSMPSNRNIGPSQIFPGDVILLSGDVGRHGISIMAVREGISFQSTIESDCAPLAKAVEALFEAGIPVRCLRDLTRGGLASALVEIAETAGWRLHIRETDVPVHPEIQGACEMLGLDPMYVANEGRFIAFVPQEAAPSALSILKSHSPEASYPAAMIGEVQNEKSAMVTIQSLVGTSRIMDRLSGEQLPRIC